MWTQCAADMKTHVCDSFGHHVPPESACRRKGWNTDRHRALWALVVVSRPLVAGLQVQMKGAGPIDLPSSGLQFPPPFL